MESLSAPVSKQVSRVWWSQRRLTIKALEQYLTSRGIDLAAAGSEKRCLLLDADETLSKFMPGSLPDS